MSKPHIVVGTPCFGGLVGQAYTLSLLALLREANKGGFDLDVVLLGGDALITRARSTVVARFLDTPGATHLLFVDADITFAPTQVLRLLIADKDFCAAFYPLKQIDWGAVPSRVVGGEPLEAAGLSYVGSLCEAPELRVEKGFATARYAGTGFQLIKRGVFERMVKAYPETHFTKVDTPADRMVASDNLYALFDPVIDSETGRYLSEDYAFCRRWRAIGGTIWLDLKSRLGHAGMQTFAGDTSGRLKTLFDSGEA
ncbi:hypothetical protein [Beijerinckia sp. L45]|uniref:hypothetical protein n=1 Tax=Beijerinckia sp. L45 TaxID=1641855 RepID=UPI00131BB662|nr:hypothetical protein [Beijerinckia sp. L45]